MKSESELLEAIREEAEKRWPLKNAYYYPNLEYQHNAFIEGAKFGLSLLPEKVYRWVKDKPHDDIEWYIHQGILEELDLRSIKPSTNLEQQNERLFRWVKASERLPHIDGNYIIMWDGSWKVERLWFGVNGHYDYRNFEWLEEINPQSNPELKAEEKIQELDSKQKRNK